MHVSEARFRRLSEQAAQLHLTPEQFLERVLMADPLTRSESDAALIEPMPPAHADAARAAFERLTRCCAAVTLPDRDDTLADPLIALANVDLDDLPH